jgi:hypothetical protein
MVSNPAESGDAETDLVSSQRGHAAARALALLTLIVAIAAAGLLYLRFLESPRLLWNSAIHDRNAHLYSGMCLAADLRNGYFGRLFPDLDAFRTWPPLHDGLLVGFCLLLGRGDERWAVLPSLVGWVGTCVLAFLIAFRATPRGGAAAGLVAAAFVLVSPAQRAFATDVMLESLGACLTLACLYFYVTTVQNESPVLNRCFALALTLLFFEKYNYWLLVVLGLAADTISVNRHRYAAWIRDRLKVTDVMAWLVRQVRHPASWLFIALVVLIAAIEVGNLTDADLFGRHISLRPTANLVTAAYLVFLMRLVPWYRRTGRALVWNTCDRIRALVNWHIWPIALWFLWPHRLYSFLWVNSPASNAGEFPKHDLFGGYPLYWASMAHDYHISAWSAATAIGLFLIAVWAGASRRLRPGVTAILWIVGISFLLTVHHQNRKSRFLHSWIPVVWVGAGVGAGALAPNWRRGKRPALQFCYYSAVGAFVSWHLASFTASAHAPDGGIQALSASILDITDTYLPDLAESHGAAVFSNIPMKHLAQWTYLKRYGRLRRLETDIKGFGADAAASRAGFAKWLATTDCDTVVYVDFPPGSTFYTYVPDSAGLDAYGTMLRSQSRFVPAVQHTFLRYGCVVTVWKSVRVQPVK